MHLMAGGFIPLKILLENSSTIITILAQQVAAAHNIKSSKKLR